MESQGPRQPHGVGGEPLSDHRVEASGKHLSLHGHPFRIKGVTYGGFETRLDGYQFPESAVLKKDLVAIAGAGFNTVRTYTLPPPEAFEIASELDLWFLVGIYYDDWRMEPLPGRNAQRRVLNSGRRAVKEAMATCAGNPNVLGIAVGNEVPVDLVRVHGIQRVRSTLEALIDEVHVADPQMLATYVNFPTTEFLEVDRQDFATFNVFLEDPDRLRDYLSHLQVTVGGLPLVISELGLASEVHGKDQQAEAIAWQLRTVDETGCAGATVFSWTDEWAVDDQPVRGWGFGLVTEDREPKPALEVASEWAMRSTIELRASWPRVSVIVCAYNEEQTISECLQSLADSRYPDLEVLVCDDGSTDRTLELIRRFPFKVLELPHGGLSRARNAGLAAASGEIVAYLDADAACHPDWPFFLVLSMTNGDVAATGGPNLPHPKAGLIERAVADSPGAPMEVLLSPTRAEHVPGCNMAFRKADLEAVGGFDPVYTSAGDDVDVCWKLLDAGQQIGFAPAAEVVHHRRNTVGGYLRQQRGYGRAEKMLSGPHRHRFNRLGQARWLGFVYGGSRLLPSLFRPVIYTGYMGMAPFQPIIQRRAELAGAWATALLPLGIPLMLFAIALAPMSSWWLMVPAVLLALSVVYGVAIAAALQIHHREPHPWRLRALVGMFHVLQPLVRAWGRLKGRAAGPPLELRHEWIGDRFRWLQALKRSLETEGLHIKIASGGEPWDLEVVAGVMVSSRVTTAVAWQWEPRYRVRFMPRLWFYIPAIGAFWLGLSGETAGWWLTGVLLVWGVLELAVVKRRVTRAIKRTIHSEALSA